MKLKEKIKLSIKLQLCNFVESVLIPHYIEQRNIIFGGLKKADEFQHDHLVDMGQNTKNVSEAANSPETGELNLQPHSVALEWLHANLSTSIWSPKEYSPSQPRPEVIIYGLSLQDDSKGNRQVLVLLQDKYSNYKFVVPLFVLLEQYIPLKDLHVVDYNS